MATPSQQAKPKRLYRAWKGNNRFFCGGRLIFGPDVASLLISTLLIAGPATTFCYQIIIKIHKYESEKLHNSDGNVDCPILGLPVLIVTLVVTISDLVFLFMTSSRDPGIVPRNTGPPEMDESFSITTPSMEWNSGRTPHLRLPRTKDVIVNGFAVKVKYCDTCMLYRLPRASHCSVCNNCVQKFDHHCPWVGQCIGLRNYRFFFLFISTSTFLCIFVFTLSLLNIIAEKDHNHGSIWKSMTCEVLSLVLIVYTFIVVWFVGGLTVFHFYLISTNQTTYENFRYRYDKRENPYNKGFLKNFKEVFLSKSPPSMHYFRSWVLEETLEVAPYTPNVGIEVISPKEKIDIEMGTELAMDHNLPIPSILQNLDYSSIDNNENVRVRHANNALESFAFTVTEKPASHSPRLSMQSYDGENGVSRDKRAGEEAEGTVKDERVIEQSSSIEVLATAGENVDMRWT